MTKLTEKLKLRRRLPVLSAVLVTFTLALGACGKSGDGGGDQAAHEPLFVDATGEAQGFSEEYQPLSLKKRYVRVNSPVLLRRAEHVKVGETAPVVLKFNLNLFDDENVLVHIDEVERVAANNVVFSGRVGNDPESAVTLVWNDGVLVANVRQGESTDSFEVRYVDGGIHTVTHMMDDPDSNCEEVADESSASEVDVAAAAAAFKGDVQSMATSYVDILGAYTPNARAKMGGTSGIVALIQLGVADTNRALVDSGANLRVRLAGTMQLKTNESGNWSRDLSYLKGKSDGRWDEVHAERTRRNADQVTVVATYPRANGTLGIGYVRASRTSAFTIVRTSAFNMYTFSHELGHNIGLSHSHGYVNSSGRFRTIIAYGSYPRIRRYSNPSRTYKGYRTGDSRHNEVSIINSRGATVSRLL